MGHQPHQGGTEQLPEQAEHEHDRVPREGRWLYVVEAEGWDQGRDNGLWLPAEVSSQEATSALSELTGQELSSQDLAVVDQVGLDFMSDEDHFDPGGSAA